MNKPYWERTEVEHLELWKTLARAQEIEKIQNGDKIWEWIEDGWDGVNFLRYNPPVATSRKDFQDQIQDAIINGDILADWISDKLRDKPHELQDIFEALTDSHNWEICDVSWDMDDEDTLFGRIVSKVPGYNFKGTKVKIYNSRHNNISDVVFLDDSWDEVQRFGFADFYADFMWHY